MWAQMAWPVGAEWWREETLQCLLSGARELTTWNEVTLSLLVPADPLNMGLAYLLHSWTTLRNQVLGSE